MAIKYKLIPINSVLYGSLNLMAFKSVFNAHDLPIKIIFVQELMAF